MADLRHVSHLPRAWNRLIPFISSVIQCFFHVYHPSSIGSFLGAHTRRCKPWTTAALGRQALPSNLFMPAKYQL